MKRADLWQSESIGKMPAPTMPLHVAIDLWLEHRSAKLSSETKKDYRFSLSFLEDHFNKPINQIDTYTVEKILERLTVAGKARTAKKVRDTGRNLYNWLHRMEWSTRNPFAAAESVEYAPPKWEEPLTAEYIEKAIGHASNPALAAMFALLAGTGVRPIAVRELIWSDLTEREDGLWMQKRVKTDASDKPMPIPATVAEMIRQLPKSGVFVFTVPKGKWKGNPYSEEGLICAWHSATDKAGLSRTKLYDLRHYFATKMRRLGVTGSQRARLMGHTKENVASEFYDQFSSDELRRIVDQ